MSYYSDLFLRPKQAVVFALEHPSWFRSVAFVVLGTLAGLLAMLVFTGTVFPDLLVESLVGDLLRWVTGGIVLLLLGIVFRRLPLNGDTVAKAFSVLAQVNVYGFLLFLVVGVLLPAVAIPSLLEATRDLNAGVIGQEEFNTALAASLNNLDSLSFLALPLLALAIVLLLYSVYVLFLSIQKFLDVTVFKGIVALLIVLVVQSIMALSLAGLFG